MPDHFGQCFHPLSYRVRGCLFFKYHRCFFSRKKSSRPVKPFVNVINKWIWIQMGYNRIRYLSDFTDIEYLDPSQLKKVMEHAMPMISSHLTCEFYILKGKAQREIEVRHALQRPLNSTFGTNSIWIFMKGTWTGTCLTWIRRERHDFMIILNKNMILLYCSFYFVCVYYDKLRLISCWNKILHKLFSKISTKTKFYTDYI